MELVISESSGWCINQMLNKAHHCWVQAHFFTKYIRLRVKQTPIHTLRPSDLTNLTDSMSIIIGIRYARPTRGTIHDDAVINCTTLDFAFTIWQSTTANTIFGFVPRTRMHLLDNFFLAAQFSVENLRICWSTVFRFIFCLDAQQSSGVANSKYRNDLDLYAGNAFISSWL